jgi:hypothetical protein
VLSTTGNFAIPIFREDDLSRLGASCDGRRFEDYFRFADYTSNSEARSDILSDAPHPWHLVDQISQRRLHIAIFIAGGYDRFASIAVRFLTQW